MRMSQNHLSSRLKPSKLLNLGTYAPLRHEDRKMNAVLIAKDPMHSHKCETWGFQADNLTHQQLDITDMSWETFTQRQCCVSMHM